MAAGISLFLSFAPVAMADETFDNENDVFLITSENPFDPKFANAGANLRTGVGSIFIDFDVAEPGGFICSMSVIDDQHILTAAHCLRNGDQTIDRLVVVLPSGVFYIYDSAVDGVDIEFAVNPLYDDLSPFFGAFAPGDIAVIKLSETLPPDVERYELYRTADEFGQVTRHYGHGVGGTGDTGGSISPDFFFARTGLNTYDATLAPFFGDPLFDSLLYDFDNHRYKNNATAWWFGRFVCNSENAARPRCATQMNPFISDHKDYDGLEIGLAGGDSGGPGFIDGKVAGVHSFGFTHFCGVDANIPDFTCGLDSSWGEMSGDTRVSSYADWVDAVVAGAVPTTPVPEPEPAAAAGSSGLTADFELSDQMQRFYDAAIFRSMRRSATFEEFKAEYGVE
jgi:hypothetical protein